MVKIFNRVVKKIAMLILVNWNMDDPVTDQRLALKGLEFSIDCTLFLFA